MRVMLFVAALNAGGAERVVSRLANAWAEQGWEIAVVTLGATGSDFFALAPGVERIGLNALAESAHPVQALLRTAGRVAKLRRAVAQWQPQTVISFCDRANILALLATRGLPGKVLVSERTDPARHPIGRFWSWMRRRTYPWADAVVVQTDAVRDWMAREIPKARAVTIANPVWPVAVAADPAPQGAGHAIVALGRLSHEKGFDLLLEAYAQVAARFPDWRLQIIGDGEQRGALEAQAARLGLAGRVVFAGKLAQPEEHLRRASLFVLPSRYEGFPNALLEAMALGLPVVSFACPSGPEAIIRQGVDGLLVPAEDTAALAAAIMGLMAEPARRAALGIEARAVAERFGPERILDQWAALIEEAGTCPKQKAR
jgi:GalNAc-alpha-(1->4)-GalNAc-alpha-(1->3)-diNAcBac-PP-undecaprenol alpha-1,4-N-acetyl-D-galactosaminyltransferase